MAKVIKKKKDIKEILQKSWNIFTLAIIVLSIATGTVMAYMYSRGWRFNFQERTVSRTGVLTVTSSPSRATIFIDGEKHDEKSQASIDSLQAGEYLVEITKSKYQDWERDVKIYEKKSTFIYPFLVFMEQKVEKVFESEEKVVKTYTNEQNDYLFIETVVETPELNTNRYKLWRFDLNSAFWDLSENPTLAYEADIATHETRDLTLSPDGKLAISKSTFTSDEGEITTDSFILHTVRNGLVEERPDIEDFIADYTFTWSADSKYIIMESEEDIITLKLSDMKKFLLKKDPGDDLWTTDEEGFIYFATKDEDEDSYTLTQMLLDGSQKTTTLENIYFQSDKAFLNAEREEPGIDHTPFTNAPENTRFTGMITDLKINQEVGGIFITTEHATYWYDIQEEKYIMIDEYAASLLSFSDEMENLLYSRIGDDTTHVFTFVKNEYDLSIDIGSMQINKGDSSYWLKNSRNIIYTAGEKVMIESIFGDNRKQIGDTQDLFLPTQSLDHFYTFKELEEGFEISNVGYR